MIPVHHDSSPLELREETPLTEAKQKQPHRALSFHPVVKVKQILHINDYTDEEYEACWYTREDFQELKKENRQIAELFKKRSVFLDERFFCDRGLEAKCNPKVGKQRQQRKYASLDAVLNEQDDQLQRALDAGMMSITLDDEAIAQKYRQASHQSRMEAQTRGMSDAEAVQTEAQELVQTTEEAEASSPMDLQRENSCKSFDSESTSASTVSSTSEGVMEMEHASPSSKLTGNDSLRSINLDLSVRHQIPSSVCIVSI